MAELFGRRTKSIVNSMLVVMATLLLGNAVHVSVVTGAASVTSPFVVFQLLFGSLAAAGGYWLRPTRYCRDCEDDGGEASADAPGDDEFDPEMSPLDPEDFDDMDSGHGG